VFVTDITIKNGSKTDIKVMLGNVSFDASQAPFDLKAKTPETAI